MSTEATATLHHESRTRALTTAALLTALLCASAFIAIPLPGGVPITLQVFIVVLAALLLTPGWAFASVGAYVLLGAAGVPVFAGGQGGVGVLVGPTGGFLMGFAVAALLGSLVRVGMLRTGRSAVVSDWIAAAVVIGIVYTLGTLQLAIVLGLGPVAAIAAGVAPFIVGDVIKAALAVGVASAVRKARG